MTDLLPTDPAEAAQVARGWAEIAAMEHVGVSAARRAFAPRWDAERARAHAAYEAPEGGPLLSEAHRRVYESPSNVTRYRRTADFITEGERLYEVGIGRGFLATMLMSLGGLGGYRGVDLVADNVAATTEMLALNGFGDRANVAVQDLYDLTRGDVEEQGASLLMCCEVIEHVPDPERALRVLADALPEGTDLLFSVPLYGRLEAVWGHTAVFNAARVQEMIRGAGLVAHHVEAIDNVWIFVLASRSTGPSPRARAAVSATTRATDFPPIPARAITNVSPADALLPTSRWTKRTTTQVTRLDADAFGGVGQDGVRLEARRSGEDGTAYAGIAFTCPAEVVGVRFQLDLPDPAQVDKLYVDFLQGTEQVARWTWDPSRARPEAAQPTFTLRTGGAGVYFRRSPGNPDVIHADSLEIFAKLRPGSDLDLSVVRLAWVTP